jgi:hypothetical protein
MIDSKGLYARALDRFRLEFIPANKGKTFTSEDVYRFFQIDRKPNAVEAKKAIGDVLYNLSHVNKKRELEQTGKHYRIIDTEIKPIEWWKAAKGEYFKFNWVKGEDNTSFGFDDSILLYPGDLIVVAGEGNAGKTSFCLNLLVENMEYPSYYFTSEFNDKKFVDRMSHFNWKNIYKEDGTPKFVLAEQSEYWQDIIQPDAINYVDWVYLDDEMYKVRAILRAIISNLRKGIAVVVLQKRTNKLVGEGGEGTKDLASVYLTIRNQKIDEITKTILKADKVKTPYCGTNEFGETVLNPNFKEWSFDVVNWGSRFCNIKPL